MFSGSRTAVVGAVGVGLLGIDPAGLARVCALRSAAWAAVAARPTPPASAERQDTAPSGGRVSGRLVPPGDRRLAAASVTIAGTAIGSAAAPRAEDLVIMPDGAFVFRQVPAGTWEIRARARVDPGGTTHYATFRLLMEGRDVENLVMPLHPAASLTGTVTTGPAGAPPLPPGGRVHAPSAGGSGFGDASGEILPGGVFRLSDLIPGPHVIRVEGLPEPWVLDRVVSRGQDVTDAGIDLLAGQKIENVRVTVTRASGEVSGRVRGPAGQPVADALVLVIPLAEQFWGPLSRHLARVRTDADGGFRVRGLPPGEYRAAATVEIEDEGTLAPAILRALSDAGTAVSLDASAPRTLDLPLSTIRRQGRPSSR